MRRGKPEVRPIAPDLRYNSVSLATFVQHMMMRGKKSLAYRLMYDALAIIEEKTGKSGIEVFETALKNVGPVMEVRPRRVGGATYQVPMEVPAQRRLTLAIRWILASSRARSGKSFPEKLAGELMDAATNQGASIRKRDETHKMAEANRAFSHYRA
ncbi:MAG: 30S ribosomal protein S7 [Anaerolineales bacterium]|nr:30S ribosomal protein S7 [Anaerolineales bacterium]MCX7754400.1 30S ribosomal protein S7 [Anaerolineales bacterium]MDW8277922.1 30S ribosomal protein S7 [Anaerolineales bacterium]